MKVNNEFPQVNMKYHTKAIEIDCCEMYSEHKHMKLCKYMYKHRHVY